MDIRILNATISFAKGLFVKSAAMEGAALKYNCDYIVEDDTVVQKKVGEKWVNTTLAEVEKEVTLEAFKGNKKAADAWLENLTKNQKSIREGNKSQRNRDGDVREGYEDRIYLHVTSATRMPVYRGDKTTVTEADNEEGRNPIYSGCRVNARASVYANMKKGAQGVFASMQGTQYAGEGTAFGGGRAADSNDFEEVTEGADADDIA